MLNAQPLGFWSSQSLVADAQRHGVRVRRPDVNRSGAGASLEGDPDDPDVRLGLGDLRTIGDELATRVVEGAPWCDSSDLVRRAGLQQHHLEVLAPLAHWILLARLVAHSRGQLARPPRAHSIDCPAW